MTEKGIGRVPMTGPTVLLTSFLRGFMLISTEKKEIFGMLTIGTAEPVKPDLTSAWNKNGNYWS